jgi:integrase
VQKLHFNDRVIDGLRDPGTYYDLTTKAFGIRVGKTTKAFFCIKDGGRRTPLGRYPETSLQDARNKAKRLLLDAHSTKPSLTLSEALDTYYAAYIDPNYRPNTAYKTKLLLQKISRLNKRQLPTITSHDINDILDKLSPSQANHVFGALRTFFGWCERRDYIAASPIRKLTKPHKEKDRKRTLTDKELAAVWNACEDDSFGKIVRLLILTGQRRGEIAALESSWINETPPNGSASRTLDPGITHSITFPPHITKNGEEHTIPLSSMASQLLLVSPAHRPFHSQPSLKSENRTLLSNHYHSSPNSNLLFPSSKTGTVITGWAKLKEALDKRSGVKDWTLHDLRRTFSTRCAELGVAPHIIERCLNHLTGTISPLARRYNQHKYLAEMKEAFDIWDTHITKLVSHPASPQKEAS